MAFIELEITEILRLMDDLKSDSTPQWGTMSAQRMVEHLTDTVKMSSGKTKLPLEVPEDKLEKMQAFLSSDKPMAKNIEVSFAKKEEELRNEEIELAIDEFLLEWIDFEDHFTEDPDRKEQHPFYGALTYDQWCRLHSKHLTHHFEQFGLI
ncbi:MAG: DUF1569 domain-containing protein [Flavobacteriia bacterium]|jgi:oxepin-CoA hydrolase/3-oxo-5,6-dehydrosuberyl-CoA semialdehyde dehydrogenase